MEESGNAVPLRFRDGHLNLRYLQSSAAEMGFKGRKINAK